MPTAEMFESLAKLLTPDERPARHSASVHNPTPASAGPCAAGPAGIFPDVKVAEPKGARMHVLTPPCMFIHMTTTPPDICCLHVEACLTTFPSCRACVGKHKHVLRPRIAASE